MERTLNMKSFIYGSSFFVPPASAPWRRIPLPSRPHTLKENTSLPSYLQILNKNTSIPSCPHTPWSRIPPPFLLTPHPEGEYPFLLVPITWRRIPPFLLAPTPWKRMPPFHVPPHPEEECLPSTCPHTLKENTSLSLAPTPWRRIPSFSFTKLIKYLYLPSCWSYYQQLELIQSNYPWTPIKLIKEICCRNSKHKFDRNLSKNRRVRGT